MIRCRSCGATHPRNTLFCDECGNRLSETQQLNTDPLPDAQPAPATPNAPIPVALSPTDQSRKFECVLRTELLIGRADPSAATYPDIDLSELQGMKQGVSRRHARLVRAGQQILLEDLNSLNGTFVRGMRLIAHNPQAVQSGDELQFGKVVLVLSY